MEDVMQKYLDAILSLPVEDRQKLLGRVRSSLKPKPELYECKVVLGTGTRRTVQWVKYAEWSTGQDSIWIEFSRERCLISEDLAKVAPDIVACAKGRKHIAYQVICSVVDNPAAPTEEVSGDD